MAISKIRAERFLRYLNFFTALPIILFTLAVTTTAQSSDADNPTPMTTTEVKGRWRSGKNISHYYSFTAGPGEVKVLFNFVSDQYSVNVGGQLFDADGRALIELNSYEEQRLQTSYTFIYGMAAPSERLVGRFNVKRRQKLTIRVYTGPGDDASGGEYKIRVEGGEPTFGQDNSATTRQSNSTSGNPAIKNNTNNNTNTTGTSCLPKSGKLRLVMDDGTVQEINLSRVREAAIKP